jgi:hypothetical protein
MISTDQLIKICVFPYQSLFRLKVTFLFMREVADGDFIGWIDRQLCVLVSQGPDRLAALREAIFGPLRNVYGVADKVLAMAMSSLLLAAEVRRQLWLEVGGTFVAVDTLVHNFLHRTGILNRLSADHPYGDRCYGPGGCAGTRPDRRPTRILFPKPLDLSNQFRARRGI